MEKIFSKAAAIAIPYSILGIACKASGHNGGAALTSGFRSLGGTFGMKGGLVTLGTIGLAAEFVTEKTIGIVLNNAVKNLCFEGESQETIFSKFQQLQKACSEHNRNCKEKCKLRCQLSRSSDQYTADDRRTGQNVVTLP